MDESGLVIQCSKLFVIVSTGFSRNFSMDKIAKRIELCRLGLNISQSELARKIGVTPQAVQKWEKGKTAPRGETLEKMAVIFGVSPAYIQFGISDNAFELFSVEQNSTEYVVTRRFKAEDWPFTITKEQFGQFNDEQLSLINRYIEILWQTLERKIDQI